MAKIAKCDATVWAGLTCPVKVLVTLAFCRVIFKSLLFPTRANIGYFHHVSSIFKVSKRINFAAYQLLNNKRSKTTNWASSSDRHPKIRQKCLKRLLKVAIFNCRKNSWRHLGDKICNSAPSVFSLTKHADYLPSMFN